MTPARLKRKTKNRLLTYSKAVRENLAAGSCDPGIMDLDILHDFAMRCYAEGWTHAETFCRENSKERSTEQ